MMKRKFHGLYYFRLISTVVILLSVSLSFATIYSVDQWTQSMLHPKRIPVTGDWLRKEEILYQEITLTTKDGISLAAWYTPPENGAVILVAHGYNDNRPENIYAMLAGNGYGVLAWDFRAHGESGGEISTLGSLEQLDVEAALEYALLQKSVERVGAWGGSMGAATILLTAVRRPEIEAVVADSAFASLEIVLRKSMPYDFLFPLVAASGEYHAGVDLRKISPVSEIEKISPRAVFIIDGWDGSAKAASFPYLLYNAANEPKEIWTEAGIPHLGMLANNPKKYQRQVINFFNQYLLGE
ncbi:MAG: alpha/beta fold hydrolase [Anaerolineales bacterium]|nr:alpha/beta fold hydrolase [Anaerolineales bacterium]